VWSSAVSVTTVRHHRNFSDLYGRPLYNRLATVSIHADSYAHNITSENSNVSEGPLEITIPPLVLLACIDRSITTYPSGAELPLLFLRSISPVFRFHLPTKMTASRGDGRTSSQIRPLACEQGLLNRADGSSRFSQGQVSMHSCCSSISYTHCKIFIAFPVQTSVLVAVYGPADVKPNKELMDRCARAVAAVLLEGATCVSETLQSTPTFCTQGDGGSDGATQDRVTEP
jgi:hypothetical protein